MWECKKRIERHHDIDDEYCYVAVGEKNTNLAREIYY
jgi:hypothetical protein